MEEQGIPPKPTAAPTVGPPRNWNRGGGTAVVAMVVAVVLLVVWLASTDDDPVSTSGSTSAAVPYVPPVRHVTYLLTGTATGADLTFTDERGQTAQAMGKAVPLHSAKTGATGISFDAALGTFLYFSAQNTGRTGSLTCEIQVDGRTVATNTSSGGYAIVTCQA